ncbi:MAG: BLUF domain-containing protein [Bacteroidota bacterium]
MDSLIYVSRAAPSFDPSSIITLAHQAYQQNKQLAVTGFLIYSNGQFLQYLEGEKGAITKLMSLIHADFRHTVSSIIHLPAIQNRRFTIWHMRHWLPQERKDIGLGDLLADVLLKMNNDIYNKEKVISIICSILDKISNYYATFPHIPLPPSDQP